MTGCDDALIRFGTYLGVTGGPDDTICLPAAARHAGDPDATFIHGGILAAFLEMAALIHLRTTGSGWRTQEFTTTFLRRSTMSETKARAETLKLGRRYSTVSVTAWQADRSQPVAIGLGTLQRLSEPDRPPR